ncbi:TPA: hypothetical protein HA265_00560 [Candidatus Woesearchaeota archaeon]|nr:hypothetical protein [Candidatus Woesearchaeota archaeon]
MKKFSIDGKTVEIDDQKTYLDFYIRDGEPALVSIDLVGMLMGMEEGNVPVDDGLREYMEYLERWATDAPRKRFYRGLRAEGVTVLSGEYFFDGEGGEKIIDNLENTGRFAEYFLQELYRK